MKTCLMANEELLPQVVALLEEGHTVTLPLRGRSMRPFLEDGRDKALLAAIRQPVGVGDVVLAELRPGFFVLHRIVGIDGDAVTLCGDGNLTDEHCRRGDLRALATGFYRKGRLQMDTVSDRKWRVYSWWWMRLRPVRRGLLYACRKLF